LIRLTTNELHIPHEDLERLRSEGRLRLGVDNQYALQAFAKGLGPTKTTANVAGHFYNIVAVGIFITSVYFSFTNAWWWFIPGFFGMRAIWKANKKATVDNYLDAAFHDRAFYERFRKDGAWLYEVDEDVAKEFAQSDLA